MKSVIPNFVACLVFLGMAFSFIKLIPSSDTLTKRECAILKICAPAIITSAEVMVMVMVMMIMIMILILIMIMIMTVIITIIIIR